MPWKRTGALVLRPASDDLNAVEAEEFFTVELLAKLSEVDPLIHVVNSRRNTSSKFNLTTCSPIGYPHHFTAPTQS